MRRKGLTLTCLKCGRMKVIEEQAEKPGRAREVKVPDPSHEFGLVPKPEHHSKGRGGPLPRFFPYSPRKNQQEMMSLVCRSLMTGGSAIIESGTGSGKTVCALAGALEYCIPNDKKVIYITRTNSQAKQVMLELRAIGKNAQVSGIALQGRRHACLLARYGGASDADAANLAKFCEQRKARTLKGQGSGCTYYANYIACDGDLFADFSRRTHPTAEEFSAFCEKRGA
jgi:DNA excision repair protein ERCC-2